MLKLTKTTYEPLTLKDISNLTNITPATLRLYLSGKHFTDVKTFKIKRNKYYKNITDKHIKMLKIIYLKRTNPDYGYMFSRWHTKMEQYYNELETINR